MRTITPHLWFDKDAKAAAELYASVVPGSKITNVRTLRNTPSGDCDIVSFELSGQPFMAISAGPLFKPNPSISFHIKCSSAEEVDAAYEQLSPGGKVMMPLDKYPFSERYAWVEDKYGISWQIILLPGPAAERRIMTVLMFVQQVCGKSEEAAAFYVDLFQHAPGAAAPSAGPQVWARYMHGEEPDKEGTVKFASFTLLGQDFGTMDSARMHNFQFNEAISLMIPCDTQEEIDYFWGKLSANPKAEQCGWLKDKFGVSWQVVPTAMQKMLGSGEPERIQRVTKAFLKMKKFDIATLEKAFAGE